uniref:Uncharacterized protein n=1 Tax=Globodera rostochiensis TaxID=31243 RepID=A0A914HCM4_GLORO
MVKKLILQNKTEQETFGSANLILPHSKQHQQQQQQTMYSSAAAAADDHQHAHHRFQHGDSVAGAVSAAASFYQPSQPTTAKRAPRRSTPAAAASSMASEKQPPQGTAAAPKGTKKSHKASTNPPAHFCPHCDRGLSSDYSLKRHCQSCPKLLGKESAGGGGKKKGKSKKAADEQHQIICDPDSTMNESPPADGSKPGTGTIRHWSWTEEITEKPDTDFGTEYSVIMVIN